MGAAALLSTAAMAGPNSSGAYIGIGFGNTINEDDGFVSEQITSSSFDDGDSGVTLYGGYQFNNIVGVELSFRDYGKFEADSGFAQEPTGVSVGANVGYSFLDGQLRPFGVIGMGFVKMNYVNLPSYVISLDDSGAAVHYGVGVQYEPDALLGLGFRMAYEADSYAIEVQDSISGNKTYTQTLGMLYLGVQYKF
jgi:hypothetical protein